MARLFLAVLYGFITLLASLFISAALLDGKVPTQVMVGLPFLAAIAVVAFALWLSQPTVTPTVAKPAEVASVPLADASTEASSVDDALFHSVLDELRKPPKRMSHVGALFAISVVAFVVLRPTVVGDSVQGLVAIVLVLLLHEAGHAVAMHIVGYADVKIFFIPFLGAVTTSVPRNVTPWKETVVLLAGPVPGLLLGLLLYRVLPEDAGFLRASLATMLIGINAFNLLPLEPLDGGRLFGLMVLGGYPRVRVALSSVTVVGLALLLQLPPGALAGFVTAFLMSQVLRFRAAVIAGRLKQEREVDYAALPADFAQIDATLLRPLFDLAHDASVRAAGKRRERNPIGTRAQLVRTSFEFLRAQRPSLRLALPVVTGLIAMTVFVGVALAKHSNPAATQAPAANVERLDADFERSCATQCRALDDDPDCARFCACQKASIKRRVVDSVRQSEYPKAEVSASFRDALRQGTAECGPQLIERRFLNACTKPCGALRERCQAGCQCWLEVLRGPEGNESETLGYLRNVETVPPTAEGQLRVQEAREKCAPLMPQSAEGAP